MTKAVVPFEAVKAEYESLWRSCEIRPERARAATDMAKLIRANRPRYEPVSQKTGVPWYVIGIIHALECGLSFNKHLHNGDPLSARTVQVPKGRPLVWPAPGQDAWTASAIDALTMPGKAFDKVDGWGLARIAYTLELYNGFGYRLYRKIASPYLWSFTTHYARGKYVADGKWSATAVSSQCGGMALLKALRELDPLAVDFAVPVAEKAWPKPEPVQAPSPVAEAAKSRTVWAALLAGVTYVLQIVFQGLEALLDLVPEAASESDALLTPLASLAGLLKVNIAGLTTTIVLGCIGIVIWRHAKDKVELRVRRWLQQGD